MLFDYTQISVCTVKDATEAALAEAGEMLDRLVDPRLEPTFENVLRPLDAIGDVLATANGRYALMGYVHPDEQVRSAGKEAEEKLQTFGVDMIFREDLYAAVKRYAETEEAEGLEGERRRYLEFVLRDLRRAGHELDPDTRAGVKAKTQRLVELGVRFQQNIDAVDQTLLVAAQDLEGLPESYRESLETDEQTGKLRVTMAYPHVIPFLENATRRDLRERLMFMFNTRAVENNRPILEEAIRLRHEIAEAFGLPTWAHHRLEERMAKDPKRVADLYAQLLPPLTVQAEKDLAMISQLLERDTGDRQVQVWDWRYYDTVQRREGYGVDPFAVAEYFPLQQVLDGMFELTSEVFGLRFVQVEAPVWHEEVVTYQVRDAASEELLGHFYLDLFPRTGKFSHAAEFPLVLSRRLEDGSYQNPVCAMVANFTKPTAKTPSLLQHSEVETLFHEFGHVLHQNLGRTELARFAGTSTETDFVEAPSQIMQHWIWRADVLRRFARHYESSEPIPAAFVDQLVAARRLNIAVQQLRQAQFGILDQDLHGPGETKNIDAILRNATAVSLLPFQEGTFFPASFGHLLAGYDATYYGYMWAEVFGDDMFSRFEGEGVTSSRIGLAYRREILERGGSLDGDQMLVNFLGREPSNEAFLRKLGISGTG